MYRFPDGKDRDEGKEDAEDEEDEEEGEKEKGEEVEEEEGKVEDEEETSAARLFPMNTPFLPTSTALSPVARFVARTAEKPSRVPVILLSLSPLLSRFSWLLLLRPLLTVASSSVVPRRPSTAAAAAVAAVLRSSSPIEMMCAHRRSPPSHRWLRFG